MEETLLRWATECGYGVAWEAAAVVECVRREISGRRLVGELEEHLCSTGVEGVMGHGEFAAGQMVAPFGPAKALSAILRASSASQRLKRESDFQGVCASPVHGRLNCRSQ